MNIDQLVKKAKQAQPALGALHDESARDLLQQVFRQIRDEIEATRDGQVRVGSLGRFRIKQARRARDGAAVRRIMFQPPKAN